MCRSLVRREYNSCPLRSICWVWTSTTIRLTRHLSASSSSPVLTRLQCWRASAGLVPPSESGVWGTPPSENTSVVWPAAKPRVQGGSFFVIVRWYTAFCFRETPFYVGFGRCPSFLSFRISHVQYCTLEKVLLCATYNTVGTHGETEG